MKIRLLTSAMLALFASGCAASPVEPAVTVTATATVTAQPSETETAEQTPEVIEEVAVVETLVIPDVVGENASDALDEGDDDPFSLGRGLRAEYLRVSDCV